MLQNYMKTLSCFKLYLAHCNYNFKDNFMRISNVLYAYKFVYFTSF